MSHPRRTTDILNDAESGDFILRRRILPVWQLFLLFALSFIVLFIVATNVEMLGGSIGLALAIFAVIGPLTWFTVYFSQQNRDMLLAAEFQNALFSAAARLKSKFVMIVKQDGTIFYYDRGFQKVFPETRGRGTLMIDKIFNASQISAVEAEKLFRALEESKAETVFVHLPNEAGEDQKIIITVDPLPRLSGFYILRGRDYVVKRYERSAAASSATAVPLADNPQASATIAHMLHILPYGLYATDAEGGITFVNYRLENWLGYNQNEIVSRKLSLSQLVAQQNTAAAEHLLLKDCEGEVQFINKMGHPVRLALQQAIVRDDKGAVGGSVAVLRPEQPLDAGIAPKAAVAAARHEDETEQQTTSPSLIAGKKF